MCSPLLWQGASTLLSTLEKGLQYLLHGTQMIGDTKVLLLSTKEVRLTSFNFKVGVVLDCGVECTTSTFESENRRVGMYPAPKLISPDDAPCMIAWFALFCRMRELLTCIHRFAEPLGQLPEEIWKSLQPLMDFVAVTATVSSKPKRVTSPLPITLSVKFTAGKSHFWQQALEDVCKASNSVRQHFSEVCFILCGVTAVVQVWGLSGWVVQTTGECLRKNFLSMLDSTSQLDKV